MKTKLMTVLSIGALLFSVGACNNNENPRYEVKQVNVRREANKVDKTIPIRFYQLTPNVPYIGVGEYFKEFFKTELRKEQNGDTYTYYREDGASMKFDTKNDTLTFYNVDAFTRHPDYISSNSKYFILTGEEKSTPLHEKVISFADYRIEVYEEKGEAYVPLTLLSDFAGGTALYQIVYNGEDIYAMEFSGSLTGTVRDQEYYKDTYFQHMGAPDYKRPEDLINYSYQQTCLMFDHDRGYTSQLLFGDNNLLTLGLDTLLETYYPKVKAMLLSEDFDTYVKGHVALFLGLHDGGHTGSLLTTNPHNPYSGEESEEYIIQLVMQMYQDPDLKELITEGMRRMMSAALTGDFIQSKRQAFNIAAEDYPETGFYYHYDSTYKTAYLGFDSFTTDYTAWDEYYNDVSKKENIPVTTDSFAFIRSGLYKALEDGAENLVLDLASNGGGDSNALMGIFSLFNKSKAPLIFNNTIHKYRESYNAGVDINLDGVYNEIDVAEAEKFEKLHVGVMTSSQSFSCGNLLPSLMKEAGYKTVGSRSGGGSCAISLEATGDGIIYVRSSHLCLSNLKGDNIDQGVPVDYNVLEAHHVPSEVGMTDYYYLVDEMSEYLNHAYDPLFEEVVPIFFPDTMPTIDVDPGFIYG